MIVKSKVKIATKRARINNLIVFNKEKLPNFPRFEDRNKRQNTKKPNNIFVKITDKKLDFVFNKNIIPPEEKSFFVISKTN